MQKILPLAVLALLLVSTSNIALASSQQQNKHVFVNIGKGIVVKGDLTLVINVPGTNGSDTGLHTNNLAQNCLGCVTGNMIAPHSVNESQLAFNVHNGTNGSPGLQGPAGRNATLTIVQCTPNGMSFCPIPKNAEAFTLNATNTH